MAYDLDEQEQLENAKAWWSKYGKWVGNITTLVLLAVASWYGYLWWNNHQQQQAQLLNDKIEIAINANKMQDVLAIAKQLEQEHAKSEHAALGVLKAAQFLKTTERTQAIALLKNILDAQKAPYKTLIHYRLAGLLVEDKKSDEAIAIINQYNQENTTAQQSISWRALFDERLGDALLIKGDNQAAIKRYQNTLSYAKQVKNQAWVNLLELKLSSLLMQNLISTDVIDAAE